MHGSLTCIINPKPAATLLTQSASALKPRGHLRRAVSSQPSPAATWIGSVEIKGRPAWAAQLQCGPRTCFDVACCALVFIVDHVLLERRSPLPPLAWMAAQKNRTESSWEWHDRDKTKNLVGHFSLSLHTTSPLSNQFRCYFANFANVPVP